MTPLPQRHVVAALVLALTLAAGAAAAADQATEQPKEGRSEATEPAQSQEAQSQEAQSQEAQSQEAQSQEAQSQEAQSQEAQPQEKEKPPAESEPTAKASFFATTTVTATGREEDSFEVATPVTVIGAEEIQRQQPENAADLLRDQPGVDVNGVGGNQARPIIRGQRGLRVLYMEDGLRLNNARRQTDFGEITSLVDLDSVEAVEVVRGPASVLYGSDAIGGVLNLVTRRPTVAQGRRLAASAEARYGSASDLARLHASVDGRFDKVAFTVAASRRRSDDYQAPAGRFGDIDLPRDATVVDTGVDDDSVYAYLDYRPAERHDLFLRYTRYRADQTGFGFVDPADYGVAEDTSVRILYPYQNFDRLTLGYFGSALESVLADSLEVQVYGQSNERQLRNLIGVNIGPLFPGAPDSGLAIDTLNFTDLDTLGGRAEAIKVAGSRHLFTYGGEYFRDDSVNTDHSITTVTLRFPFPPFEVEDVEVSDVPNAPDATNTSYGVFVQDEITAAERLKLTAGMRYQRVSTRAEPTAGLDVTGLDFEDDNVVWAVNALYRVADYLHLVASYGTAFRAPNIIERLFNGPTPEGTGFQILNPDLKSERSDNYDLGLKYRRRDAWCEAIYFRSEIDDGIIQHFLTDAEIAALPQDVQDRIAASGFDLVVQQRNVDRIRYRGVEVGLGYRSPRGFALGGNYTHLTGERIGLSAVPLENTFSDKVNLYARYERPSGRFWLEYRVRHQGSVRTQIDPGDPVPPVGKTLPGFTVHTLAGGVRLFERGRYSHTLTVTADNFTDELYAEFSNATFFRPQPGRDLVASYRVRF